MTDADADKAAYSEVTVSTIATDLGKISANLTVDEGNLAEGSKDRNLRYVVGRYERPAVRSLLTCIRLKAPL